MRADIKTTIADVSDEKLLDHVASYVFRPAIRHDYSDHSSTLPDFVRLALWAHVFESEISNSGVMLLLDRYGSHLNECFDTFDQFKCPTVLNYLDNTRSLFPDGKIPDDEDERWDCLNEIEFTLREVDRKHAHAIAEIIQMMKEVISSQTEKWNQQIEQFWAEYSA